MADSSQSEKSKAAAESPTTAREMDFDDEPQETGTLSPSKVGKSPSPKPKVSFAEPEEEAPPSKPPRPLSPNAQAEHTLIEAFPNTDVKVIKAVLTASGGKVEPAFNALLGMSDPDFKPEEAPPPRPPRPTQAQKQLEADEMYARQLAEHYQSSSRGHRAAYVEDEDAGPPLPTRSNAARPTLNNEEREHSFFDDDLPVIRENVRKGFLETQKSVNKWITDFKKRIDGDEDDPYMGPPRMDSPPRRQNYGPSQSEQLYGIRRSTETGRKSTDRERYDADPHVLGDDFTALELRDDEDSHRPASQRRPLGNPNLYKANVAPPQSGPVDEVDAADRKNQHQQSTGSASKSAKWQPLTSVAPNPESEENDPFSLGDSDDEKESKSKDIREADSNRLKDAARKSISGDSNEATKGLQASERTGSIDKDAEALLKGKKS